MLDVKGFTLVELIVVVAVIAILAGIAVPLYTDTVDRAQYSELVANIRVYEAATQAAITKNGFPTEIIVWGDGVEEADEWNEDVWIANGIDNGIIITIDQTGKFRISFEEESQNYERYARLIEKYGELEEVA